MEQAILGLAASASEDVILGLTGVIGIIILIVVFVLAIALYFLPTIIAAMRKKRNIVPIVLLNLFLGWSFIGWIVSLVWALKYDVVDMPQYNNQYPPRQ